MIIKGENNSKKRTYLLHVNNQNIAISLGQDLGSFKHFYSELLDHVRPVLRQLLVDSKKARSRFDDLNRAIIGSCKYLSIICITSDLLLWRKRPLDDDTLHIKFNIFYLKEIHIELCKIIPGSESICKLIANQLLFDSSYGETHISERSFQSAFWMTSSSFYTRSHT